MFSRMTPRGSPSRTHVDLISRSVPASLQPHLLLPVLRQKFPRRCRGTHRSAVCFGRRCRPDPKNRTPPKRYGTPCPLPVRCAGYVPEAASSVGRPGISLSRRDDIVRIKSYLVVDLAFIGIAENVIRLGESLNFFLRDLSPGLNVRMVNFPRQCETPGIPRRGDSSPRGFRNIFFGVVAIESNQ